MTNSEEDILLFPNGITMSDILGVDYDFSEQELPTVRVAISFEDARKIMEKIYPWLSNGGIR